MTQTHRYSLQILIGHYLLIKRTNESVSIPYLILLSLADIFLCPNINPTINAMVKELIATTIQMIHLYLFICLKLLTNVSILDLMRTTYIVLDLCSFPEKATTKLVSVSSIATSIIIRRCVLLSLDISFVQLYMARDERRASFNVLLII